MVKAFYADEPEKFHAASPIDRVDAGTSDLIPGGGRINLTLRRVTVAG